MTPEKQDNSLDLLGFGKLAKAIPEEVYTRSAKTLLTTFEKLTAPITEFTSGFGRYLRQKFDNMVNAEKVIAIYTIEEAIQRAKEKAEKLHCSVCPPAHPKSFIKAIEEASKETDPVLHVMWANLLASQMIEQQSHPHFVEILPHFSPAEAHLLISLFNEDEVGKNAGGYLCFSYDKFLHWIRKAGDTNLEKWTYSCVLLCEFGFANVLPPKNETYPKEKHVTILFRTISGNDFLASVTP